MAEPSPHKRETSDDRRAAIAQAAQDLILEKGFEGLRTRDIADRVGINVATLHYHVPSKDALIELVAASMKQQFMDQHRTRPRAHLSAEQRMEFEFVDFRELVEAKPEVVAVMSELMDLSRRDPRIAAVIRPMQQRWREILADLLAEGMRDGVYRPDLDPSTAALMIIGALTAFGRAGTAASEDYDRLVAELKRAIRNPAFSSKE